MPLVTSTEMFKKAYEGKYAVGAFNVNNMKLSKVSLKLPNKNNPRSSYKFPQAHANMQNTSTS